MLNAQHIIAPCGGPPCGGPILLSQLGDGGRADSRPVRHGSEEHGAAEVQSAAQETGICQQAAPQAPCRYDGVWAKRLETCSKTVVPFSETVIHVIQTLLKYRDNNA